jgi:3-phytase
LDLFLPSDRRENERVMRVLRGRTAVTLLLALALLLPACASQGDESAAPDPPTSVEEPTTSEEVGTSTSEEGDGEPVHVGTGALAPTVETDPVPNLGDAADDPAIWVHPSEPAKSTIIGTDKKGGIAVYDLDGSELQYLQHGRMNNVDLRDGFPLGGDSVALVTAGNRRDDSVAVYRVDVASRTLVPVGAVAVGISTYGSCMYRSPRSGKFYYLVNSQDGEVEQWELFDGGAGEVEGRKVRSFDVGSQTEGCVADDELGHLYIGEESEGIWRYSAEPEAGEERTLVDSTGGQGHLEADVEGLAIAYGKGGAGYLLASSQGNDSFALYRRGGDNRYVRSFRVKAGNGIDAVGETDGIDVSTAKLGPMFPRGVFVAQDGKNDDGNQNYKLIPWQVIVRR